MDFLFDYWYIFALFLVKFTRCIIFNLHNIAVYSVRDVYNYVKYKKWTRWHGFGINMFVGYFGSGKSCLASNFVVDSYYKFKDSATPVTVYSNIELACPYIELSNYQQILEAPNNSIIFIDEINSLFNSRNWKDFPIELVYLLCQNRKRKIMLLCTAPRFHLVDKSIRDVVDKVYSCKHPFWRFHHVNVVDGWELENCPNVNMITRITHKWYFVTNKYYAKYNTDAIIDNAFKTEFLNKNEIVSNRQGQIYGEVALEKTTGRLRRRLTDINNGKS